MMDELYRAYNIIHTERYYSIQTLSIHYNIQKRLHVIQICVDIVIRNRAKAYKTIKIGNDVVNR